MNWQSRISTTTGEPAVPIFNRKLRGDVPFWVPRRYIGVVAVVMNGRRFTLRQLMERTGYSLKGLHQALWSLHEMAVGTLTTVRGCHGYSRFVFNQDCVAGNVSTNVRSLQRTIPLGLSRISESSVLVETFGGQRVWYAAVAPGVSDGAVD